MRSRNLLQSFVLIAMGIVVAHGPSLGTATTQEKPIYKPNGREGTMIGEVAIVPRPPAAEQIDTSADAVCTELSPDLRKESLVVANNRLANVVVYVRGENLNQYSFEPSSPVVILEHKRCRYVPHVLGMQMQQTLKVLNSDPVDHNTHAIPKNNPDWKQTQEKGAAALEKHFTWPEIFIPFRDNLHPWEKAYLGVFSHPFFAVSAANGTYKISGLPPGHYTLVAWHETLGEQTADVVVSGIQPIRQDFVFAYDR